LTSPVGGLQKIGWVAPATPTFTAVQTATTTAKKATMNQERQWFPGLGTTADEFLGRIHGRRVREKNMSGALQR